VSVTPGAFCANVGKATAAMQAPSAEPFSSLLAIVFLPVHLLPLRSMPPGGSR